MLKHINKAKQTGFSLLEMMVATAIFAILAGMAVGITDAMATARAEQSARSVLAFLKKARQEAVSRGRLVAVCPASFDSSGEPTGCVLTAATAAKGKNWESGMIAYVIPDNVSLWSAYSATNFNSNIKPYIISAMQIEPERTTLRGKETLFRNAAGATAAGMTKTAEVSLSAAAYQNDEPQPLIFNPDGRILSAFVEPVEIFNFGEDSVTTTTEKNPRTHTFLIKNATKKVNEEDTDYDPRSAIGSNKDKDRNKSCYRIWISVTGDITMKRTKTLPSIYNSKASFDKLNDEGKLNAMKFADCVDM